MKNVPVLEISNDPNAPRAIDVFREYSSCLKDNIIIVDITKKEIVDNIDLLNAHKCIIWYSASSLEDAKEVVKFVRDNITYKF